MSSESTSSEIPAARVFHNYEAVWQKHPRLEWILLLLLCAAMLAQLLFSVRQLSQTEDEAVHLYSGYRYLRCGDLTFSPEHPPLAKIVATVPLLFMHPRVDCSPFGGTSSDEFITAFSWLYTTDWHSELLRARFTVSIFSVILCVLVWATARKMFGKSAAILAALLLAFEPNLLAHGALVTTDMAETAMLVFAVFAFYLWIGKPCITNLALAGVAVGCSLLAKNSGVLIILVLIILAILDALSSREVKQRPSKLLIRNLANLGLILLIAYAAIWMGYGFRYSAHSGAPLAQSSLTTTSLSSRALHVVDTYRLLPQAYLEGFASALDITYSSTSTPEFILGRYYPGAQWFSLPIHLLIRCTLGFLAILLLSGVGALRAYASYKREFTFLLVPIVIFAAAIMHSSWNAGMRHMLPILPFLIIIAAAGSLKLARSSPSIGYVLVCLLILHAASSLHAFPNYLSYGNEFWGGPTQTYKHLGGETDWGQSYSQITAYMDQHPGSKCWLFTDLMISNVYRVPCTPVGIFYRGLAPTEMTGIVLVETNMLYSRYPLQSEETQPFKNIPPADTIGGSSILVFKGTFDTRPAASMSATAMALNALTNSQLSQAEELSDYAVRISPSSAYAHYVRAGVLAKEGDNTTALTELKRARSLLLSNSPDLSLLPSIDVNMRSMAGIAPTGAP